MAVKSVRVEMNHAAAKALLSSPEVQAELDRRGQLIAAQAGGAPDFEVRTSVGSARARTIIITATPDAMRAEATERRLSNAFDAGRG